MQTIRRGARAAAAGLALFSVVSAADASLIVNGSFEDNIAGGTIFNPSNAGFNSVVNDVTAYGSRQGIDIQTAGSGYGLAPIDGRWKVSPASDLGGLSEEFSMALSGPLTAGQTYELSFYIERLISGPFDGGTAEVGLSTSDSAFGSLVASATAPGSGWLWVQSSFVAPNAGSFLSVRVTNDKSSWVGLDGFVLTPVPEPSTYALLLGGLGLLGLRARRRG